MSKLVDATRTYDSFTANGAVTHSTSLSKLLDFFFLAGASRKMSEDNIIKLFLGAWLESKVLAAKVLFWARDARQGAGEKRIFQVIMSYIQTNYPDDFSKLFVNIPEYGYYKDLFSMKPTQEIIEFLAKDLENNLLCKWFPRKGEWFNKMRNHLGLTPKEFRKLIVSRSNTVEQKLCANKTDEINYSHVPSIAMNIYRKTFFEKDKDRYQAYIDSVLEGKTKINASVLFPHQLVQAYAKKEHSSSIMAQWEALPNYMEGSTERIIPVCDVSGSMKGLPMEVSIGLGLYISERNEGIFKDAFITFSSTPKMHYLKGNVIERMRQLARADWGMTTNLQATFDLILNSAVRESIPESEMPTKILIISDMEFNSCGRKTNLDVIKQKYEEAGYKMPTIIFWNVNGRMGNSPATVNDKVGLVSGFSPSILKSILKGEIYSPTQLMLDTVDVPRYACIEL